MRDLDNTWCYIARTITARESNEANTVVAVTVDRPEFANGVAIDVATWIKDGLTIERVPLLWARDNLFTTNVWTPTP